MLPQHLTLVLCENCTFVNSGDAVRASTRFCPDTLTFILHLTRREVRAEEPVGTREELEVGGTEGSLESAVFEVERPFYSLFLCPSGGRQ